MEKPIHIYDLCDEVTWREFRMAKMLTVANDALAEYGYCIVVEVDADGCSADDIEERREPVLAVKPYKTKDGAPIPR